MKLYLLLFTFLLLGTFSIAGSMIQVQSGNEKIAAYAATPEGKGPFPALILIHEWWGLNDQIKGLADRFAKEGYVSLAVDLYRGKVATNPEDAHQYMSGLPEDRALRDLKASYSYLQGLPNVKKDRIGSVGWCMGGRLSGLIAMNQPGLAAAAIFYGSVPTDAENLKKFGCPVIGFYGENDKAVTPDMARAFDAAMKKLGKPAEVHVYPGAGHGFMNETGQNYNETAAKDAWSKVVAFFAKHLKA